MGCQRSTQDLQLIIKDSFLEYVKKCKYLGTIDTNLDYQLHRQKLFGKVQNKLNYLAKISIYISERTALIIYKTTIMPLM